MKSLEKLWDLLGNDLSLLFGRESAGAIIWMFWCLLFRLLLLIVRLEGFVALGIIFAFPIFIQMMLSWAPILRNNYPLLPVRLAEGVLGRLTNAKLLVVIPAHFLGTIFGAAIIQAIHPPFADLALRPIQYEGGNIIVSVLLEIVLVALFVIAVIVLPVLLEVNRRPVEWLTAFIFPLLLIRVAGQTITFNPAVNYALWYVSGTTPAGRLQLEHLVGPIVGGVVGGLVCKKYFPDDPNNYRRKEENEGY